MFAHVDADAFFASVLQRQHPRLRGKPVLALGMGGGCVIAASYEAKAHGVKTGMRLGEALRLCPSALRMPSDFRETGIASTQIEEVLQGFSPRLEQTSVDEWFMDVAAVVGGIPSHLDAWAQSVRVAVLKSTSLSVSVGVGPSKTLAKMASEFRKPGGVTVVRCRPSPQQHTPPRRGGVPAAPPLGSSPEILDIAAFLQQRPAAAIPGIGPRRQKAALEHGWTTAWDIAAADAATIVRVLGKPGDELRRELLGACVYPLDTSDAPPQSVSRARSFRASSDERMLWAHTLQHLQYLVLKMRRHALRCRGISFWLRDSTYVHHGTHASMQQPADTEAELTPVVRACFDRLWHRDRPSTQVGLALWGLQEARARQASLFDDPQETRAEEELQTTLDAIRTRFGRGAIHRGAALSVGTGTRKDLGFSVYE